MLLKQSAVLAVIQELGDLLEVFLLNAKLLRSRAIAGTRSIQWEREGPLPLECSGSYSNGLKVNMSCKSFNSLGSLLIDLGLCVELKTLKTLKFTGTLGQQAHVRFGGVAAKVHRIGAERHELLACDALSPNSQVIQHRSHGLAGKVAYGRFKGVTGDTVVEIVGNFGILGTEKEENGKSTPSAWTPILAHGAVLLLVFLTWCERCMELRFCIRQTHKERVRCPRLL